MSTQMLPVDLDRYPITDLSTPPGSVLVAEQRRALAENGYALMPGFVPAARLPALVLECERLEPEAHHHEVFVPPYFGKPDLSLPEGHPRRHVDRTALAAVPYDRFPHDSLLRRLYESDALLAFFSAVLQRTPLYRYGDPLSALNLSVMGEGDVMDWHFDQADFVVSLAIQSSERGGEFETVSRVRSATDEAYETVGQVLAGKRPDLVRTIPMTPGSVLLFEGRHSLHRVVPIEGPRPRYVALLSYDTVPGTMTSERFRRKRYGR